ncbi:MAG: hypothetical protein GQ525_00015 [Draconibacterium sp.]|nr:hypothetical protein [Draconibacterium sp.]
MIKQDLLELIDSWENLPLIIKKLEEHHQDFDTLMEIALYSNEPQSWRAAYIADKVHENYPNIVLPFINKIILQLKVEKHSGKKRHFLRQISLNPIPEPHFGFLVDYCLNALTSAKELPAVRVHAMQILYNISEKETDLKPEILAIIEHEMEYHSTAAILSRGSKLVNKLRKQIERKE